MPPVSYIAFFPMNTPRVIGIFMDDNPVLFAYAVLSMQTRSLRQRAVTNENDENGNTTRLTRAKAAALSVPDSQGGNGATKRPLQSKKSVNTSNTAATRKRSALGDVSNMTKVENGDGKDTKKATASRVGLTSKATTQSGGVQKITRTNTSRSALGAKDTNKRDTTDTKQSGSGSGALSGGQMKRSSTQKSVQSETAAVSEEPPRKKVDIEKNLVKTEKAEESVANVKTETETDVKAENEADLNETEIKQALDEVVDLDVEDLYDPLMVAEYAVEIFDYLRELELTTMPNPEYMDHQEELEWKMRGILVDWLIEVHTRFRLLPETLFLAVNIIDRFLSAEVVALDRLQLVGVTAMFIAAKYEEVLSPHVATLSHVADETFSDKEILDAERHVLAVLNYDISYPNPMNFLRRISKADNYDIETRTLGKYLTEVSLLDHRFMCYRQSHVAASAMYLARLIMDRGPWVSFMSCVVLACF